MSSEILINSSLVTSQYDGDAYEFVLNQDLQVIECIKVDSLNDGMVTPIDNASFELHGMLFELNHVRVNPRVDNTEIISCLTSALEGIGVQVNNAPDEDQMAMCFKPLGEISDNVRFYLNNKTEMVFLSPSTKPKLVAVDKDI